MEVGYTSLISIILFFGHFTLMTWSADNEGNQNFRLAKRGISLREYFPGTPRIIRKTNEQKGDESEDEKSFASQSNSIKEELTTEGRPRMYAQWNNDDKEEVLRYFYLYQLMGAYKGSKGIRDWEKLTDSWIEKHGYVEENRLRTQAYFLRGKIQEAAREFDAHHLNEIGIPWLEWLNDDLMKVYYATEKGLISRHGERMRDMWRLAKYPGYQKVRAEYLLNRAKGMLEKTRKPSPEKQLLINKEKRMDRRERESFMKSGHLNWRRDHDKYLYSLWEKEKRNEEGRMWRIHHDALQTFPEFKGLTAKQVYKRASYVWNRNQKRNQTKAADQELVTGTHGQHQTFKYNQMIPSIDQEIYYHPEWIASTSSQPGSSHRQPDL